MVYHLWWVFAIAMLFIIFDALPGWIRKHRAKKTGVNKLDKINGKSFEIWLEELFRKAGYGVERTPYQKDHGVDLILTTPQGSKIAVQAKKKGQGNTGAQALGEVLRGQKYYKCDKAMVVTNQGFTEQAIKEARKLGIELVDRKSLIDFVNKVNSRNKNRAK